MVVMAVHHGWMDDFSNNHQGEPKLSDKLVSKLTCSQHPNAHPAGNWAPQSFSKELGTMEQGRDPWGCHIQMGKSGQSALDKHHQKRGPSLRLRGWKTSVKRHIWTNWVLTQQQPQKGIFEMKAESCPWTKCDKGLQDQCQLHGVWQLHLLDIHRSTNTGFSVKIL